MKLKLKHSLPLGEASDEELIREMLSRIPGEKWDREGLLDTPRRVVSSRKELFGGYAQNPKKILGRDFDSEGFDGMIMVPEFEFASMCEHHILPFTGTITVAYIPNGRIVGLSKIPRMCDAYARRLQVQERLTKQIAETLYNTLGFSQCLGVAVVIKARHSCMCMRGVRKHEGAMRTHFLMGAFKNDKATREEFFASI